MEKYTMKITTLLTNVRDALKSPQLDINLFRDAAKENNPFFFETVSDFYHSAIKRHPKFPLIRNLQYGMALFPLPETHDDYLKMLASSARRNIKKAKRQGYEFKRINYNDYLDDISAIHGSTAVRQGAMDPEFLTQKLKPIHNPESLDECHDYPYFGVIKDGTVVAYAGCLVAGEMLLLATIFGHDKYKSDGIVPFLIASIAEYKYNNYPHVKYYVYDKYYGASDSLRSFKRKFRFEPHTVNWQF